LVYLYGNSGNMGNNSKIMSELNEHLNCYVLSIDYRGFGGSYGFPSESGIIKDIESLLRMIYDDSKFKNTKIILFGKMIGANGIVGVLENLKESNKLLYDRIDSIILENTFDNTKNYINLKYSNYIKYIPDFILNIIIYPNSWETDKTIKNINKKTLILYNNPVFEKFMKKLYDNSPNDNKKIIKYDNLKYYEYIRNFIN
jgi:pimeloyl-ACP methyl ester carboxylesterase